MTLDEVEERARRINSRVYGGFLLTCLGAVATMPLVLFALRHYTRSVLALVSSGLTYSILFVGIGLFGLLYQSSKAYARLRVEVQEDAAAENFANLQKFIHEYKKEREETSDAERDEDFRPGDPEQA
jgi:hypothetical protein